MPSEVMYTNESLTTGRRFRSNSEQHIIVPSAITAGSSTSGGSLTFLKKLWKDKKDKRISIIEYEESSSNSPSPKLFRRNRRASQQPMNTLTVNTDDQSRSRSPSPSLFRKGLGRRSSTTNEKTNENVLHYAVSHQDYSTLEKLLSDTTEKVDVNCMRPPGVAVLHQACVLGNLKIVQLLVNNGADIRQKTWSNLSPLKVAVLSGSYEIAQYLVSVGASSDDIKNGCQIDKNINGNHIISKRNNSF